MLEIIAYMAAVGLLAAAAAYLRIFVQQERAERTAMEWRLAQLLEENERKSRQIEELLRTRRRATRDRFLGIIEGQRDVS